MTFYKLFLDARQNVQGEMLLHARTAVASLYGNGIAFIWICFVEGFHEIQMVVKIWKYSCLEIELADADELIEFSSIKMIDY